MTEYMNKEVFLSSMGLTGDETKYGNRDAKHQSRSYATYMSYEIMDGVEDSIVEEELAPVRYAQWDVNGRCTACGGHAPYFTMSSEYYKSPFCHECGAIMGVSE